jgi:hypothetical protein
MILGLLLFTIGVYNYLDNFKNKGTSRSKRGQWVLSSLHSEFQMQDLKFQIGLSEICNLQFGIP